MKFTNFGVRTIEWKPTGFYLNGERVQLNGVASTTTWDRWAGPPTRAAMNARLKS